MLDFLQLNWFISVPLKSEDMETWSPADFHTLKGDLHENLRFVLTDSGQVYSLRFQVPTGLLVPVSPGEEKYLLSSKH